MCDRVIIEIALDEAEAVYLVMSTLHKIDADRKH